MFKEIIINTGIIILIINFVCFFVMRKKFPLSLKIFTLYLFFIVIIQVSSSIMASYKLNNLFFSHYYFIIQFFLISLFFRKILDSTKITKIIDVIIMLVLSSICIYYLMYPHKYFKFNNFEIALTSIPLIIYCFMFIVQKLEKTDRTYFYIVSGLFIYLTGSTLLFSTGNIKSPLKKYVWLMNGILYIIYQSLIFIEWYKFLKMRKVTRKNT